MSKSLQDRYAPSTRCFGCGPANEKGLQVKSQPTGGPADEVAATWRPSPHHEAFDGFVNGGILGTLLDCHSNWTAALHLMRQEGSDRPPCTVTAEFHVKLRRPTPSTEPVRLRARVVDSKEDRATIEATLESSGVVTATCRGLFVAVQEGHPAYHRW